MALNSEITSLQILLVRGPLQLSKCGNRFWRPSSDAIRVLYVPNAWNIWDLKDSNYLKYELIIKTD